MPPPTRSAILTPARPSRPARRHRGSTQSPPPRGALPEPARRNAALHHYLGLDRNEAPLKQRSLDEWREIPAIDEVADALREHIERGYPGLDRTWTSPTGRGHLDWGNIRDDYLRPACSKVFAGTDKANLATMPPKTLRKAAITWWADSGIPTALAADWAGHSEEVAARYYAGRASNDYTREVALLSQNRTH